ncbi:putative uncharacterized protein CXorf42 isoform X3 [Pongo pygmaeus]|uniref:putative uncharacterized protein CXorf42 isoform X3 n=1 Tax=Pongo pygmaeus TaxID=9600 RepID=UPI00300D2380
MPRFRGCSSSSVRFCSAEREASGSGRGNVLQFVQEPQAQQSRPFPAGAQLSLELLFSDWGMEWAQPRLPKPALPLPLVVSFSRAAVCAARHHFRFCLLVRLLRQLLTLLRDEEREVNPWQSWNGREHSVPRRATRRLLLKNSSLVIQVKDPRKEERKIYRKENTRSILKIAATVTLILKQTPVVRKPTAFCKPCFKTSFIS